MMTRTIRPGTLIFVESEEEYSVYLTRDHEEVYLQHGTARRLLPLEDLDLTALWYEYRNGYEYDYYNPHTGFRTWIADRTIDIDDVEDIAWCDFCASPYGDPDALEQMNDEEYACGNCRQHYTECDSCEERFLSTSRTLDGDDVCDGCRASHFWHCGICDGLYHHDDSSDHSHEGGCDCEAPAQSFKIRNDGDEPLKNDTRVTITLPAGVISDEGISEIANYLRNFGYIEFRMSEPTEYDKYHRLSWSLGELGDQWQTKQGNYTKRLSRLAYKKYGLKVPPEVVSRVGCIARDHSAPIDFDIEITRNLNLSAAEFAHEESCWWQSYHASRCALKNNGGFGIRTFSNEEYSWVEGRAWVMPLRHAPETGLRPTFETLEPDAYVVFNGYGNLGGYTAARILTHMTGMTYRKVGLVISPMYINSDAGYLVAPEEIAEPYTDGSLSLSTEPHSNLFAEEKELTDAA